MGLRGHFSNIIIDEAAQALEPEALVPVSLAGTATRVTLAGKPLRLNVSRRLLLDGVAMPVPHLSTEPARPRHCREMTS